MATLRIGVDVGGKFHYSLFSGTANHERESDKHLLYPGTNTDGVLLNPLAQGSPSDAILAWCVFDCICHFKCTKLITELPQAQDTDDSRSQPGHRDRYPDFAG
jgi:hypothetical protein